MYSRAPLPSNNLDNPVCNYSQKRNRAPLHDPESEALEWWKVLDRNQPILAKKYTSAFVLLSVRGWKETINLITNIC